MSGIVAPQRNAWLSHCRTPTSAPLLVGKSCEAPRLSRHPVSLILWGATLQDPLSVFGHPSDPFPGHASSSEPPPPPYHSLVLTNEEPPQQAQTSGYHASTSTAAAPKKLEGPKEFEIYVTDPVKQGDGVGAYVSYKVWSKTRLPQYKDPEHEVIRRYRDFDWLANRLSTLHRGVIVPPLPEKNAVSKISVTTDFIESRRRSLQVFLNKVACHPVLKTSPLLQLFLEGSEIEWRTEVDRVNMYEKNMSSKFNDTIQFFKGLGSSLQDLHHNASNIMSGRTDDEEEDPEYLKVREYMTLLEGHLTEAHRQATRIIKKQNKLADAFAGFGASTQTLSSLEDSNVQTALKLVGQKAEELATITTEQTAKLNATFEEPLKEFCRYVKSVKGAMADRTQAMSAYQQIKQDAWGKRNKLTKLKGTPGVKDEKVAQAERDLNEATQNAERAKQEYDLIVKNMSSELTRFQTQRAAEISEVLREFAIAQAKLASDTAKAWRQVIPEIAAHAAKA